MPRTTENWIEEYRKRKAYWVHDGNPNRPHVVLTSGLHSTGYFNSRPITEDFEFLKEISLALIVELVKEGFEGNRIQGFVGPQTGASPLAQCLALTHRIYFGSQCLNSV